MMILEVFPHPPPPSGKGKSVRIVDSRIPKVIFLSMPETGL
jgi:hypothetical protein